MAIRSRDGRGTDHDTARSNEKSPLLPARSVGLEGGDYEAQLYYLGRSVHDYGRVEVSGAISDLVLSQIRDETTFVRPDAGEGRSGVLGLPINGLPLTVRDEHIQSLELHVYSFFDFGSSIWTNRYDQVLLLEGKEMGMSRRMLNLG